MYSLRRAGERSARNNQKRHGLPRDEIDLYSGTADGTSASTAETCSFTMPDRTGSTAANGATSPGGSEAGSDHANHYYRNFKWQRGKSVTPTLRLGGASVWFIHNPNAINICYSFHVHVQHVPGAGFSER